MESCKNDYNLRQKWNKITSMCVDLRIVVTVDSRGMGIRGKEINMLR